MSRPFSGSPATTSNRATAPQERASKAGAGPEPRGRQRPDAPGMQIRHQQPDTTRTVAVQESLPHASGTDLSPDHPGRMNCRRRSWAEAPRPFQAWELERSCQQAGHLRGCRRGVGCPLLQLVPACQTASPPPNSCLGPRGGVWAKTSHGVEVKGRRSQGRFGPEPPSTSRRSPQAPQLFSHTC